MAKNKPTVVRVQLDLPADRITDIEELMAKTGVATRKDVFENALTLFEWAVIEVEKGRVIASVDEVENGYRELVMPSLASIRKHEAKIANRFKKAKAQKNR